MSDKQAGGGLDEKATLDRGDEGIPVEGTVFRGRGALSHGLDFREEVTVLMVSAWVT